MSTPTLVSDQITSGTRQVVVGAITGIAVILALVVLYAVFLDQGQLLSPVMGNIATSANYLHELAHDGRHLLGAPCH